MLNHGVLGYPIGKNLGWEFFTVHDSAWLFDQQDLGKQNISRDISNQTRLGAAGCMFYHELRSCNHGICLLCTFDQLSWFSEQKTDTNPLVGTIWGTSRGPVGFSVNITQDFPCHRLAADNAAADSRGRRGAAGSAQVEGGSLRASRGSSTNMRNTWAVFKNPVIYSWLVKNGIPCSWIMIIANIFI